jgi:hypothetical protein
MSTGNRLGSAPYRGHTRRGSTRFRRASRSSSGRQSSPPTCTSMRTACWMKSGASSPPAPPIPALVRLSFSYWREKQRCISSISTCATSTGRDCPAEVEGALVGPCALDDDSIHTHLLLSPCIRSPCWHATRDHIEVVKPVRRRTISGRTEQYGDLRSPHYLDPGTQHSHAR